MAPTHNGRELERIDLDFYVRKLQKRLLRQLAQFESAEQHIEGFLQRRGAAMADLVGMDDEVRRNTQVKDHVRKTTLVGLKTEFELFLQIAIRLVVRRELQNARLLGRPSAALQKLFDRKVQGEALIHSFAGGTSDASELLSSVAVPGLDGGGVVGLIKLLGHLGDLKALSTKDMESLSGALVDRLASFGQAPPRQLGVRSQIATAFQVRHAIEHTYSKVAWHDLKKFALISTEGAPKLANLRWERSTWAREELQVGMALTVLPEDIEATAAAMGLVAETLLANWKARWREPLVLLAHEPLYESWLAVHGESGWVALPSSSERFVLHPASSENRDSASSPFRVVGSNRERLLQGLKRLMKTQDVLEPDPSG